MQGQHGPYSAFEGRSRIASGEFCDVALAAKVAIDRAADQTPVPPVLVFDDASGETIEFDWRGSLRSFGSKVKALERERATMRGDITETAGMQAPGDASSATPSPDTARGPGRPRLGVVAREVTLLPRHWDWLASQPGGASVALRKLVDAARRATESQDRVRKVRAAAYRFMSTLMGNAAGFEEACRALFAGDKAAFDTHTVDWPADVRLHLGAMLAGSFSGQNEQQQDE
jgi:hypothetical protein